MNYYKLPEGFMRSAVVNMITGRKVDWVTLSKATKGFTDIKLSIQMNGLDVDPEPFIASIGMRIEDAVRDRLNELVRGIGLEELAAAASNVDHALKLELYKRARALDIDLHGED